MKKQIIMILVLTALMFSCTSVSKEKRVELEAAVLPDTGQSRFFDEEGSVIAAPENEESIYYGQDASFSGNELSYKDNGDGTVTDLNTGLMWQKTPDYDRLEFEEAQDYCEELELGNYDDWRMPTIKELYSLAYFNGELIPEGESQPYIDTDYFDFEYDSLLFAGQYWSNTVYVKGGLQQYSQHEGIQGVFGFNFADGHIKSYETGYFFDGTAITTADEIIIPGCYVRAVRNTTDLYDMEYVDNSDGTVTDNSTGLMWLQEDSGETMNWLEALDYAKNSETAGYSDWRLPSSKELQSLVDYEKETFPAIDTDFFAVTADSFDSAENNCWFWTSTTQGDFKYTACYIAFGQAWSKKNSSVTTYYDWHGAGAQRSDPKAGEPSDYELASEMASDYISISNYVRLVRDAD